MKLRGLVLAALLVSCSRSSGQQPSTGDGGAQRRDTVNVTSSQGENPALTLQERRLFTAATIALPPAGLVAESLPQPGSPGAHLLVQYCTQCHALPSPAMHGAVDWPAVARRMWVRIDMMHGELGVQSPQEGDRTQLLTYLTANALRVAESLPPGAGRETFQAMCSRCHLLPDPKVHSGADWPNVIVRMEGNMQRMKVPGITHQQAEAIIGYLRMASHR